MASTMVRHWSFAAFSAALALSLAVSGCAGWDELGQERKTPLSGTRKALFPEGIPGVEFNAPPQQPSNSNIAIQPSMGDNNAQAQNTQPQEAEKKLSQKEARAQKAKQDQEARAAAQREQTSSRTAARSKKNAESEDPWSEAR